MIVPSKFPTYFEWWYYIPFHTYSFRIFLYNEFHGEEVKFNTVDLPTGESVLELFDVEDVNPVIDVIILACYGVMIHFLGVALFCSSTGFVIRKDGFFVKTVFDFMHHKFLSTD